MDYERKRLQQSAINGSPGARSVGVPGKRTLVEDAYVAAQPAVQRSSTSAEPATEAPAPSQPQSSSGDAAAERGATPARQTGGAMLVGSAMDTQPANDGLFTPTLVAKLEADATKSFDDLLREVALGPSLRPANTDLENTDSLEKKGEKLGKWQQPSIVEHGAPDPGASNKRAVLVANQTYPHLPPNKRLKKPDSDAKELESQLVKRGYEVRIHSDQSATDMASLWQTLATSAKPGDDLIAHFGGHGTPQGLLGNDHQEPDHLDIFTYAQVSGVLNAATGQGAYLRFIMDSCHSGRGVQTVHEERQNALTRAARQEGVGPGKKARTALMIFVQRARQLLLEFRGSSTPQELKENYEWRMPSAEGDDSEEDEQQQALKGSYPVELRKTPPPTPALSKQLEPVSNNHLVLTIERIWRERYMPVLAIIGTNVGLTARPPHIFVHEEKAHFASQLKYLDALWRKLAEPPAAPAAPAPAPPTGTP